MVTERGARRHSLRRRGRLPRRERAGKCGAGRRADGEDRAAYGRDPVAAIARMGSCLRICFCQSQSGLAIRAGKRPRTSFLSVAKRTADFVQRGCPHNVVLVAMGIGRDASNLEAMRPDGFARRRCLVFFSVGRKSDGRFRTAKRPPLLFASVALGSSAEIRRISSQLGLKIPVLRGACRVLCSAPLF